MTGDDPAARAGNAWDALLSSDASNPANSDLIEVIGRLHAGDDAPRVNPVFAARLGSQLTADRSLSLEEPSMNHPFPALVNRPAAARARTAPWRRPGPAFNMLATVALIIAVAFGAFLISRPSGGPGSGVGQIAAPASPTLDHRARLIMLVSNCPAGYDVFHPSEALLNDCPTVATGVSFTLSGNGIAPITHQVIARGWVDYYPLEAGQYSLTEAMPPGVTSAFLSGCVNIDGPFDHFPFSPMARIGADGKLVLTIQAGDKFACSWYNVPAAPATPIP